MEVGKKRHHFVSFPSEAAQLNLNPVSSAITEVWADPDSPTTSIFHTRMQHWSDLNLTQVRIFATEPVLLWTGGFNFYFWVLQDPDPGLVGDELKVHFDMHLIVILMILLINHNISRQLIARFDLYLGEFSKWDNFCSQFWNWSNNFTLMSRKNSFNSQFKVSGSK